MSEEGEPAIGKGETFAKLAVPFRDHGFAFCKISSLSFIIRQPTLVTVVWAEAPHFRMGPWFLWCAMEAEKVCVRGECIDG